MIFNGVQIGFEAYERAIKKFGYQPSSNDDLAIQNKFLALAAKIQTKLNELENIKIED
jgi:hypothetical protein